MTESPSGTRPISPEATSAPSLSPLGADDTGGPQLQRLPGSNPNAATDEEGQQGQHYSTDDRILALIERVALDPGADVGKLSQLMDLRERWRREKAEEAFNAAKGRILIKLADIRIVKNRSVRYEAKGRETFKYAPLEDIDKVIGPMLAEEQLDLSFSNETLGEGRMVIRGRLKHLPLGHFEDSTMAAPMDTSGGKNNVQAVGSSNSYLRRYVTCNIFNIVVVGDDDDGAGGPMTEEQAAEILDLMKRAGEALSFAERAANNRRFVKYMGWPAPSNETPMSAIVAAAPVRDYRKAKSTLLEQIAKQ